MLDKELPAPSCLISSTIGSSGITWPPVWQIRSSKLRKSVGGFAGLYPFCFFNSVYLLELCFISQRI